MPVTYWTFLIGAAALAGIPLLSGFYSKDDILYAAFLKSPILWLLGTITAVLTAVYAFRAVFVVFWGQERDRKLFNHAHESPRLMTAPLIVLAAGAVLAGYVGTPFVPLIQDWLAPVFGASAEPEPLIPALEGIVVLISALAALGGAYFAYRAYVVNPEIPRRIRTSLGWFFTLIENKFYVDQLYNAAVVQPLRSIAGWFAGTFDPRVVDGGVNGVAWVTGQIGAAARRLQTGFVAIYALSILFGAVLVLVLLALGVR